MPNLIMNLHYVAACIAGLAPLAVASLRGALLVGVGVTFHMVTRHRVFFQARFTLCDQFRMCAAGASCGFSHASSSVFSVERWPCLKLDSIYMLTKTGLVPVIGQTALWWPFGSSLIPAVLRFHHLLRFGEPQCHECPNLRRLDPEHIDRREARACVQPAPLEAPAPDLRDTGTTETGALHGLLHVRLADVPRLCNLLQSRFVSLSASLRAPGSFACLDGST